MNNTLRMVLGAIITLALAWVILSLILQWARPSLYSANGAVNWWTTLWVTLVTVFILWIVLFILYFLTNGNDKCCDTTQYNTAGNYASNTAAAGNYASNAAAGNYASNAATGNNYSNYSNWGLW